MGNVLERQFERSVLGSSMEKLHLVGRCRVTHLWTEVFAFLNRLRSRRSERSRALKQTKLHNSSLRHRVSNLIGYDFKSWNTYSSELGRRQKLATKGFDPSYRKKRIGMVRRAAEMPIEKFKTLEKRIFIRFLRKYQFYNLNEGLL